MPIIELPEGNVPAAQAVVNEMLKLGADKHPVLTELRRDVFRGGRTWVLYDGVRPVSLNCTKFGKRHKNIWEPYANWYGAYTLPDLRRRGHAYRLYAEVERLAVLAGCRRIKSLAGSRAGLGLHRALHHQCWGRTENDEVFVDSVLPGHEGKYTGLTPPQAPGTLLGARELDAIMKEGLRYDK
jgi:GNAT superfamily N-acetyltransferase